MFDKPIVGSSETAIEIASWMGIGLPTTKMVKRLSEARLALVIATALATYPAAAQNAKSLKTKKNVSIALVNLLNAKPDCSANVAPIAVPEVRKKPTNGTVQMTILIANVAASDKCRERKVPVITLIYTPKTDFVGDDAVVIDIENGNKTTSLSYNITVQAPGETL